MDQFHIPLLGIPNSGKSTLYNKLTGAKSATANFPGVSQNASSKALKSDPSIRLIDLPGFYGMDSDEPESIYVKQWLQEFSKTEKLAGRQPTFMCILDGYELALQMEWLKSIVEMGTNLLIVINKHDLIISNKAQYDLVKLADLTGATVLLASAKTGSGVELIQATLTKLNLGRNQQTDALAIATAKSLDASKMAQAVVINAPNANKTSVWIDRLLLNPWLGFPMLLCVMLVLFQLVFVVAQYPVAWLESCLAVIDGSAHTYITNEWLLSFISEALLGGVGTVVIFLPPILLVTIFLNALEQSGYISRISMMVDSMMVKTGLGGYSIFPLLVGFSCAIPAIYSARSIPNKQSRMLALSIIPIIPCSARLPAYTLIIAAFIPDMLYYGFNLQGIVLLGIYTFGLLAAILLAWLLSKSLMTVKQNNYFVMELPNYEWPSLSFLAEVVWNRLKVFLKRVGTLITAATVVMWLLLKINIFGDGVENSIAGWIGKGLEIIFTPIGFDWAIATALIPGTFIAREVVVSTLAVIYNVSEQGLIASVGEWSIPTMLAFLVWQILAPQCLPTYLTMAAESSRRQAWKSYIIVFLFSYLLCFVLYQGANLIVGT